MKFILFFLLGSSVILSADLASLQKAKERYKHHHIQHSQKTTTHQTIHTRILAVFQTDYTSERKNIGVDSGIVFQKCLVPKVCIYQNTSGLTLSEIKKIFTKNNNTSATIRWYQKEHFIQY